MLNLRIELLKARAEITAKEQRIADLIREQTKRRVSVLRLLLVVTVANGICREQ